MWRTIIASYVLDIPTIQELIRTFHRDLFLAGLCGIHSEEEIPSRFAYYRFIKKLIDHREFIEKCMAKTIEALKRKYPDLGKIVVVDSTDIESYVNWRRRPLSDQDAEWRWRKNEDGEEGKYPGYKMHLAGDAKYEIPLGTNSNSSQCK